MMHPPGSCWIQSIAFTADNKAKPVKKANTAKIRPVFTQIAQAGLVRAAPRSNWPSNGQQIGPSVKEAPLMPTTLADIEDMIARIALGDRNAFSALYDATSAKLFGTCLRVLKDRAIAEDVLQVVYMKVWRHADRYASNGTSPMTWLITIARNAAIDRLRRIRASGETGAEPDANLPASGPTPEQTAIARSEAGRIAECLDTLEPDRSDAVRGAYLDGLSYADLAARHAVPLNTMRTWLRRSLQSLRECMAQ